MKRVRIWDKTFELSIPYQQINKTISRLADEMNRDLEGRHCLFICILNGAFMFASDLLKQINLLDSEISFLKIASYRGTSSKGEIRELIGLDEEIQGRSVVILEDIIDSGLTIASVIEILYAKGAREVKTAALLVKPEALKTNVKIDYTGLTIKNDFVVGYGLDYDKRGRNLIDIYSLVEETL